MTAAPLRVLFVDPFRDESEMYEAFLRPEGFDVELYADAALARQAALDRPPDVVLARLRQSDPHFDGLDLTRALKGHPITRHVPTVLITTSIAGRDREAASDAGCDSYILLPCDPHEVAAELRRVVARARLLHGQPDTSRLSTPSPAPPDPSSAEDPLRH